MKEKRFVVMGTGSLGSHLARILQRKGYPVLMVINRGQEQGESLASELQVPYSRNPEDLPDSTTHLVLTIPDQALGEVLPRLPKCSAVCIHTSGSLNIKELDGYGSGSGVFYPLQSFSREVAPDWTGIPVFVEGSNAEIEADILDLAADLGCAGRLLDSDKRLLIHLSAVFASNFTNFLQGIAQRILLDHDLPIELLRPLVLETVVKAYTLGAHKSQTGPARRGDAGTVKKHLDLLSCHPMDQELYSSISEKIRELYFPKK